MKTLRMFFSQFRPMAAIIVCALAIGAGVYGFLKEDASHAELNYTEYSAVLGPNAGGIIPASCESGESHYQTKTCWNGAVISICDTCPVQCGNTTYTNQVNSPISNGSCSYTYTNVYNSCTNTTQTGTPVLQGCTCNSGYTWNGAGCIDQCAALDASQYCTTDSCTTATGVVRWGTKNCSTSTAVNGQCASTHYSCTSGSSSGGQISGSQYQWSCMGSNGGFSVSCTEPYNAPTTVVNGKCATTHYNCTTGTRSGGQINGSQYEWACMGSGGGYSLSCTEPYTAPPPTSSCPTGTQNVTVTGATSGGTVWGTNTYTEDSYVPMAAVHAGIITAGQTATIKKTYVGELSTYTGTTRNGVTSQSYGTWCGMTLSVVSSYSCSGSIPSNAQSYGSTESSGLDKATSWTHSNFNSSAKCEYQCNTGYSWNGSSCTASSVPDLTPSLPTASASTVARGNSITFNTNTIRNSGSVIAGPHSIGGFYIDNNGDGEADYTSNSISGQSFLSPSGSYSRQVTYTIPSTAPVGSNYRISYIVDVNNTVSEGTAGENNNFSGWSAPFTVTAPGSCTSTTVGQCNLPAATNGQNTSGSCTTGYSGTCAYTCSNGTWTSPTGSCNAPVVTTFKVCTDGTSNCTDAPGTHSVAVSTPLTLTWGSNSDSCSAVTGTGFSTNGLPNGSDGITSAATPNTSTTYTVACSYGGGTPVQRSLTILTASAAPTLTSNKSTVAVGGTITLSWDTNNGNEGLCTLTGGGLTSATLTNGTGDAETGSASVTITGRTTFTLTCNGQVDLQTVEVIPVGWES
jgi:hypothetical protein